MSGIIIRGRQTFVAVRKQHNNTALSNPLGLSRSDELIDDDLRTIGKVTELRLPHDERIRVGQGISELESKHSVLTQRRVTHGVVGLIHRQLVQRYQRIQVLRLVVQHVMSVRERASLDVLAAKAYVGAFDEQRAERDGLTDSPVGFALLDHFAARVEDTLETCVHREVSLFGRHLRELLTDFQQCLFAYSSVWVLERTVAFEESYTRQIFD